MAIGHLKIFFGEEQEDKVFVLEEGKNYLIGRVKEADIRLKDIKVSRNHCRVKAKGGKYYVEDVGSRNGTFVNGERIKGIVELKDGDQVRLGFSVLQFFLAEKGTHVVESPARAKKCVLCSSEIGEADFIAGRAEEVDGKNYCRNCMGKMQQLFEEKPSSPPAAPAPAGAAGESPASGEEPDLPLPPSHGEIDLADLIDDREEEDLDLLPRRDEEHKKL
jgi:predicted component of type VI protein secretion system